MHDQDKPAVQLAIGDHPFGTKSTLSGVVTWITGVKQNGYTIAFMMPDLLGDATENRKAIEIWIDDQQLDAVKATKGRHVVLHGAHRLPGQDAQRLMFHVEEPPAEMPDMVNRVEMTVPTVLKRFVADQQLEMEVAHGSDDPEAFISVPRYIFEQKPQASDVVVRVPSPFRATRHEDTPFEVGQVAHLEATIAGSDTLVIDAIRSRLVCESAFAGPGSLAFSIDGVEAVNEFGAVAFGSVLDPADEGYEEPRGKFTKVRMDWPLVGIGEQQQMPFVWLATEHLDVLAEGRGPLLFTGHLAHGADIVVAKRPEPCTEDGRLPHALLKIDGVPFDAGDFGLGLMTSDGSHVLVECTDAQSQLLLTDAGASGTLELHGHHDEQRHRYGTHWTLSDAPLDLAQDQGPGSAGDVV